MFEKIEMKINSVNVQTQTEHGLRANFMNLLYTNEATKETVMETACYAPDTNDMEADIDNDGFNARMAFFRYDTGEKLNNMPVYAYRKTPVTFIGGKFQ